MGLLSEFQTLINEHSSSSILRERLLLLVDKVAQLEEKNVDLQEALGDSHVELTKLRRQLKEQAVAEEFTEYEGALFKKNETGGGYHATVYCPVCLRPLGSFEDVFFYTCRSCDIELDFTGHDLPRILKE